MGQIRKGGIYKDPRMPTLNWQFRSYQNRCKRDSIAFNLTFKEFIRLSFKDCVYCGSPPSKTISAYLNKQGKQRHKGATISRKRALQAYVTVNGIDRVNSSLGYSKKNSVPCCSICNRAKHELPLYEFYKWMHRLLKFQQWRLHVIK